MGNFPLLFYALPSLWYILARLMFLPKDPRVTDSCCVPWSLLYPRLDDVPQHVETYQVLQLVANCLRKSYNFLL